MTKNEAATLRKGLLVLEFVQQSQGITLKEVMKAFDLSKSTAFRLLTTLENMDYIYKIHTQYFFNPKMFNDATEKRPAGNWANLHSIYQTAQNVKMSTYLGKMDDTDLVIAQALHDPFKGSTDEEIGNRSKIHQSALGKVILAHLDDKTLESLLAKLSLEPATENIFQDSQLFRYHLKAIRKTGYAFDDEEQSVSIRCVAVPVFRENKVIAALAAAAPIDQISSSNIRQITEKLDTGSQAVTKEIEILKD